MFYEFKDTEGKPVVINSEHIVYYRPTENEAITFIQLSKSEENKDFIHVAESVEKISKVLKVRKTRTE